MVDYQYPDGGYLCIQQGSEEDQHHEFSIISCICLEQIVNIHLTYKRYASIKISQYLNI